MAKKVQKTPPKRSAAPKAQPSVEAVIPVINEKAFGLLCRKRAAAHKEMQADRSSLGGTISDAVEKQHLHKGAFGLHGRLDKMSSRKRSELLHHFDYYRSLSDWDDQLDLFRTKAIEEGAGVEEEESDQGDIEDGAQEEEETVASKRNGSAHAEPTANI